MRVAPDAQRENFLPNLLGGGLDALRVLMREVWQTAKVGGEDVLGGLAN
jgi:hypothetical protein